MSRETRTDWLWHVWINRRQDERRKTLKEVAGVEAEWEHSLYEFKNMLNFLEYGHEVIRKAFEGKLATTHQQCSQQAPVKIETNVLRCACEGTDVTQCPILISIKSVFDEHQPGSPLPEEYLYRTMARTCAWHSYKIACHVPEGMPGCDLSEGYLLDESDRIFWRNVYDNMVSSGDADRG